MAESKRSTTLPAKRSVRVQERQVPTRENLRRRPIVRYIIVATTVILVTLLFPRQSVVESRFHVGSIWLGDTIRAPFAFPLYKDDTGYKRDTAEAVASVLPVFVPSTATFQSVADSLQQFFLILPKATQRPSVLSQRVWDYLQSLQTEAIRTERLKAVFGKLNETLREPYRNGIIDRSKSLLPARISVRRSQALEDVMSASSVFDSIQVIQFVEERLSKQLSTEESLLAVESLTAYLNPTYLYSTTLTQQARSDAIAGIARTRGVIAQGDIIVIPGQRITEEMNSIMSSLQHSRQLRFEDQPLWRQLVGNLAYVLIMLALGSLYLYYFRPRILTDNLQIGIISSALLLVSVMGYLSLSLRMNLPIEFLILIPSFSMLLAILFDSRTAFYLTVVACFLVSGVRGNDFPVAIACLVAGVLAAYTVRDIKSRTQLFRSIGFAMLGYVVAILALGLQQENPFSEIATRIGFAAINATISPVLTFGALLLIETLFGVATDLKLLEYDNLNHPLLRELSDKAPGTYQHTLSIARLCERAAAAIGANPLLAKVGAYYHDIGKLAKPEYFVENQMQMGNKHDKLKPEQSARIIRDHIADGLKLAQEYKLPQRITDFIPMHHGTTPIRYFLDKARGQNAEIDVELFRYPGPRPNSRETAILMLADATEAITRTLTDHTPERIEDIIEGVIAQRMDEKQLDECNLTLADLAKIKEAFVKDLIGVQHPRVKYQAEPVPAADPTQPVTGTNPAQPDDAFGNSEPQNQESPIS